MKKVAATKGQSVRRTNFFRVGTAARGWGLLQLLTRLAVANFYGFLLKRLTLATASPLTFVSRLPGVSDFPGISAELVRSSEITGNFHRCKIFLECFVKFDKGGTLPAISIVLYVRARTLGGQTFV